MVLKEIAFLQKHTRASEQRIFGLFHWADVCLRSARSRGREFSDLCDLEGNAVSVKHLAAVFADLPRDVASDCSFPGIGWPGKNGKVKRRKREADISQKSSGKSVINRLLTLKCLLLYTAHHHSAVPPSAPSGPARRPGKVCDLSQNPLRICPKCNFKVPNLHFESVDTC